ncbi:OmpA family protein [Reichenbachiella versicolor]|uniref:OmpA family protein n=1 Tax=Reichenbachiella versicolor TaxID=1821036 RepID=UPI000D6EA883|nr:OmpA family protein [Reichenbachiella versicolor]
MRILANPLCKTAALLVFALFMQSTVQAQDSTRQQKKGVDIIITQSPKIIINLESTKDNFCNGEQKGAIDISAEGGYPPYKYYWSHGATSQDVAGLAAGTYKVAVYDGFSCSDTLEIEIKQPEKLEAKVIGTKDILCFGYNQGEIDIDVEGGIEPYAYSWSNGTRSQDLTGVISGEYSVLVTDANNCQEIVTAEVKETPLIVRSVDDVKNILCQGDQSGEVNISVDGGRPPYSYNWNNGATTQDISNLPAGNYEVTVTDSEGCSEVSTAKVHEPEKLELSFDRIRNVRCFGDHGGAIDIHVQGGVQPYKYDWSNGLNSQDIAGVQAGEYSVKVVDENGCLDTLKTSITQPENLEVKVLESKNVSFHGGADGNVSISVEGGTAPYKYQWNNNSTTQNVDGLKTGNYNVRVTDATGCNKIVNVTIEQPAELTARIDYATDIKCFGDQTGEIGISVEGGVQPYTFNWNSGQQTEDLTALPAGEYSVTITDANDFKIQLDTILSQPDKFAAEITTVTDILCFSEVKGGIDVDVTGGLAPYKYHWSNGMITQDISDVPAGDYSVKILDANRCELNLEASITQPEELVVGFNKVTNVLCFDQRTGAIDVDVQGGSTPYTFEWNNGLTTQNIAEVKAGDYEVIVKDNNGCEKIINTRIEEPELLLVREGKVGNIDCFGNNTGEINLNVSGGVKPYNYVWNTGDSIQNLSQLAAGKYTLSVMDKNGCKTGYDKLLTSPPKLKTTLAKITNNLCAEDRLGEVNVEVSGGVKPYNYQWNNGATSQDIVDVKSGLYKLEIVDTNGCKDTISAEVTEPPVIETSVDVTHILCYGENTGAINLSVKGGKSPYTYKWSNGSTTQDISDLKTGQYSVVVTDANGCTSIRDVVINQPTKFIAILESEKHIKCYGQSTGAVTIRTTGGVTPYTFAWSNGATTQNLAEIPAGEYTLTATDANGCTQIVSSTINQPSEVKYTVKNITNVNCFGAEEGAIDISITGGVGPYQYSWSNGATTQDLVNVPAGKYKVQIAEGNGCQNDIDVEIKQPPLLVLNLDTLGHVLCNGNNTGFINVSVEGGTAPYKYSWSNGSQTQDIKNLVAGKYTLTVTDAKGCTKTASTAIKEPTPFVASILNVEDIKCSGDYTGKIALNVMGGVKPYTFKWSNGATTQNLDNLPAGTYSVSITDANGCIQRLTQVITQPEPLQSTLVSSSDISCAGGSDGSINISVTGGTTPYRYMWSNRAQTQDISDVMAGNYAVIIKDKNGCTDSTINVTLTQPEKLIAEFKKVTNIRTFGNRTGAIDLAVKGGVAPYRYSWSNGSATEDISTLPAGNYSVNVEDSKGCEVMLHTVITQPPALEAKISRITNIMCQGESTGAIESVVTGGVKPYTFSWTNGDSTQNVNNIPAGEYALTVVDANGHVEVVPATVTEPIGMNIQIDNIDHVLCNGATTGSIALTVIGGVSPYTYSWNTGQNTQDLTNIPAGDYEVTVTDKNGCQKTLPIKVEEPEDLQAKIASIDNVKCNGDNEGNIRIEVLGGEKPYKYSWSNGEKSQNLNNVIADDYQLVITDANGCIENLTASVTEPPKMVAEFGNIVNNNCFQQTMGSIETKVTGGAGIYTYSWNTGDSTRNIKFLKAGDYDVIIRDTLGCEQKLATTIEEPEELLASIVDQTNIKCSSDSDGAVSIDVEGGTSPYQYEWSSGHDTKDLSNLVAGQYKLTVRDDKMCTKEVIVDITEPTPLQLALDTVQHNLCNGDKKGLVDITVSGGVTPYQYFWSNGERTEDLINVISNAYTVQVKDANDCKQEINTEVTEPEVLIAKVEDITNVNCYGDETGVLTSKVTGGVAPYSYNWNNGSTQPSLNNVMAGNYTAIVTDQNGCTTKLSAEIEQPVKLISTIDAITDIQCFGEKTGAVYVTALEGVEPYQFAWSNGETTEDIIGLSAGKYELSITQGNGCVSTLEAEIVQPPSFETEIADIKDVNCFGESTGSIDITAAGGVEPYEFAWSNGATSQNISEAVADDYSVMITDANGCLNTINASIEQPDELELTIDSVRNVKCCGDQSGAIFISVNGGTEPYKYQWSNGATTQDIQNLILGRYTVVVTDAVGCEIRTLDSDELNLYEQVVTTGKFITRNIEFDVGKSTIKPESFRIVNKIATLMKEHPDLTFRIEGHTDADGTIEANQRLSENRSKAIKEALIKFGIADSRLYTKGWGESKPIASNLTQEGKRQNRRVEFVSLTGTLSGKMVDNEGL